MPKVESIKWFYLTLVICVAIVTQFPMSNGLDFGGCYSVKNPQSRTHSTLGGFEGHPTLRPSSSTLQNVYCAPDLDTSDFGRDALGMEKEAHLSPDALGKALSFVDRLPHQFNKHRHATGLNAWDQPRAFQINKGDQCTELTLLSLHWHQLAGIHSAARSFFVSDPVASPRGLLIADEVGLGKTALSIAIMAFLNQVKTLQDRENPFLTQRDAMDSLPHLIVCPGTLRAQWIAELKTLFKPKSVDVLVYDGRSQFWSQGGAFSSSKQSAHNRIIVMTHSLLFMEMKRVYENEARKGQRPWEYPDQKRSLDGSVFSQRFLTVVIDEAHEMRNMGNKHWATLRILEQATVRLILTATPLLTSPKDVAAMGRLTGVPHFHSEKSLDDERELSAAIRRAKKQEDTVSVRKLQVEAVRKLQKCFDGWILRRTIDNRDFLGELLLNLPPHKEIIGVLRLTERETQIINERAELAKACVISANETGKFQTKKFYMEYRTAVGYAKDDPDMPNPKFKSLAEWEPVKSTKMDVCARICQYYLSSDDVSDVTFEDGKPIFVSSQPTNLSNPAKRHILIFAEFPSMTLILRNVLSLYNVQTLAIDGKMKFDRRDKIIKQFHQENQPRVLIFSKVGAAGLNLSIADVVIFFDQPWSAQDERQIRGRAHRQPQNKVVKAIHLLASDSSDLLMNDMARGKRDMFDAFVNKTLGQELRDLLSGKAIEGEGDVSDEEALEDNRERRKKRKRKAEEVKTEKKKDEETAVSNQKRKGKGKKGLEQPREGDQVVDEAPSVQDRVVTIPHEQAMDVSEDEIHAAQGAVMVTATYSELLVLDDVLDTSGDGLLSLLEYTSSPPDSMPRPSSSPGPSGPATSGDEDAASEPRGCIQAHEQIDILPAPEYPENVDDDDLEVLPRPRPSFPPATKRVRFTDKITKQPPCTNDGSIKPSNDGKKTAFSGLKSMKRSASAFSSQAPSSGKSSSDIFIALLTLHRQYLFKDRHGTHSRGKLQIRWRHLTDNPRA
ncbi:P-loop containing nucleoside triphosphate hydrolase protein [Amanita muscaria]